MEIIKLKYAKLSLAFFLLTFKCSMLCSLFCIELTKYTHESPKWN